MSRKLAREIAFKVVFSNNFQHEMNENNELELENIHNIAEALTGDTDFLNDNENDELTSSSDSLSAEDRKYIEDVCVGVSKCTEELDEKIKTYLKGWTMDRIGKTDLAILRLAIYEILYREDIPYKVSINEAVELAKTYCDDASPSFINGLLAALINSISNDH
ncbi:MAG: transcription antitermination factor NusB [Clostridia bacterium]|nr:transcription antitermination factor NusB [Clostridia bacterium]